MRNKRNKVERCKSKVTFLAYLDTHPWLRNETYYWTGDNKIKCQICDKIIPTASKMKQHSKGIKHKKKLVHCHRNSVPSIIYQAISLSNKIASISNLGIVETLDIDKVNIEHVMMEKEGTNLQDVNVIEDCFNPIGNDVRDCHSVRDLFNDNVQVDEARVDKAEAKQIQEYASSESFVQMPIGLFSHGEAENMKDCANVLESIFKNIFNNLNTMKLKYS